MVWTLHGVIFVMSHNTDSAKPSCLARGYASGTRVATMAVQTKLVFRDHRLSECPFPDTSDGVLHNARNAHLGPVAMQRHLFGTKASTLFCVGCAIVAKEIGVLVYTRLYIEVIAPRMAGALANLMTLCRK